MPPPLRPRENTTRVSLQQIPAEVKASIWIPHIKLIASKLSGELTWQIWLDRAGVTLMKYQISVLNIDQPIEDTGG